MSFMHETISMLVLAAPAAGEEPASLFEGTFWQALAAVLAFLILLAVLTKYAWGPIINALQQREAKIRGDLEEAERAQKQAHETLAQYKAQLAEARKEAQQMIEQSRAEAGRAAAQIKEQAQQEITQMRERAQREIATAKEQAVAELYEQTAALATDVAGQILRREISAEDQRALVEASLGKLNETQQV